MLRRGVAIEVVQHLLGHAGISTTIDTYSHLGIEDARRALVSAGVLQGVTGGRGGGGRAGPARPRLRGWGSCCVPSSGCR
ncbi:MAG: hypothetical protein IPI32_14910 [Austwickia sp.]|nr:hypothetical protein [Austwickia sp.]